MKSKYLTALLVAAFVILFPLSARAEIKAGSFEISPFGGYNVFQKSQNADGAFTYGGRLGYNFTPHWGIEATFEQLDSDIDDENNVASEGQFGFPTKDIDVRFYHLDAVYHFVPTGRVNPFFVVGVGGAHYDPKIHSREMGAINVGLGAKFWLTERIALRADVRDYYVTEFFQSSYHNLGAQVGVVFSFGGDKKVVVASAPAPVTRPAPASAPPAFVGPPAPVVVEKVVVLEDVHFDHDSFALTADAKTILKRNIQLAKENPGTKIRIEGHTSAIGTSAYNMKLSANRANAVKDYLVSEGQIASDRLRVVAYGEGKPLVAEKAPVKRESAAAKANRVVIFEVVVR